MTIYVRNIPVSFWVRQSVRYLLVFRVLQAIVVIAVLSFVLTCSRVAAIDQFGNRADIYTEMPAWGHDLRATFGTSVLRVILCITLEQLELD